MTPHVNVSCNRVDELPLDVQSRIYAHVTNDMLACRIALFSVDVRLTRQLLKDWLVLLCAILHMPYEKPILRRRPSRFVWNAANVGHRLTAVDEHCWAMVDEHACCDETSLVSYLDLAVDRRRLDMCCVPPLSHLWLSLLLR